MWPKQFTEIQGSEEVRELGFQPRRSIRQQRPDPKCANATVVEGEKIKEPITCEKVFLFLGKE